MYLNLKTKKEKKKKKEAWIAPYSWSYLQEDCCLLLHGGDHSPSLRLWLAASDEGGGEACRMRGSHAAAGRFSRERKLAALQPSSRASAEPTDYTRVNGDQ